MSFIKIDAEEVTSPQGSVTLTGFTDDCDTYLVYIENAVPSIDAANMAFRLVAGGVPQITANYDRCGLAIYSGQATSISQATGETYSIFNAGDNVGNATDEAYNATAHIFNARSSSEYTLLYTESVFISDTPHYMGSFISNSYNVNEVHDGIQLFFHNGNIASGKFSLYGYRS